MSDFSNFIDMTTTSGTILLNAGLPWTNPLKIQIGSDEHIIDTTINRGLLMLLNNDYYLDAKTSVLSKELSSVIDNVDTLKDILLTHINDHSIHDSKKLSTVIQNITNEIIGDNSNASVNYNDDKLQNDTIKYLSIGWSAAKINSVIKSTPHNLNTYTLIFVFVVPEGYVPIDDEYICNIENECIEFSNFYNGTLFVQGDYLHEKTPPYESSISIKTEKQINDPVGQDSVNLKMYLSNLQNEILNPEEINDIIESENEDSLYFKDKLKKIKISGTAVNDNYSVMSFKNISARTYVKNLSFKSSLKNDDLNKDALVIEDFATKADLPTNERLLLFYPLENDYKPTVGYAIRNQINSAENRESLPLLSGINALVLSSINSLSTNVFGEDGLIEQFDNQINVLNSVNSEQNSTTTENYLLTSGQILTMKSKFEELSAMFDSLTPVIMSTDEEEYFVNGEFKNDDFTTKLMTYQKGLYNFKDSVSTLFDYSGLQGFIFDRSDLAQTMNYTSGSFDSYKNVYLVSSLALIDKAIASSNVVFGNMTNWLDEDLTNVFTLVPEKTTNGIQFTSGTFTTGNEQFVNFNNDTNTCTSLEFMTSGVLKLNKDDRQMNKFLFNSLFENVYFQGIASKQYPSDTFNSASQGATICFWVRKNGDATNDNIGFLEFKLENNSESASSFKLYLNDTSDSVIINNSSDSTSLNHAFTDLISNGEWQMVQYFIDNNDTSLKLKRKVFYYEFNEYAQSDEVKFNESDVITINKSDIPESNAIDDYEMTVGFTNKSTGHTSQRAMKGRFRNLSFFVGSLTPTESRLLFERGIRDFYDLPYENNNSTLSELIKGRQFYLGLLGVYSVDNINILNCVMKYNGKSYIVK